MRNTIVLICLFIACGVLTHAQSPKEFKLPAKIGDHWELTDETEVYEGEFLFDYINGGAEIYHEFGFIKAINSFYQNKSYEKIRVEFFIMSDPDAAFGIFQFVKGKSEEIEIGDQAVKGPDYIQLRKGSYYMIISKPEEAYAYDLETEAKSILPILLPDTKSSKIGTNVIKYLRGPIALSNVYSFHYKNIFEIEEGFVYQNGECMNIKIQPKGDIEMRKQIKTITEALEKRSKFLNVKSRKDVIEFNDKKGNTFRIEVMDGMFDIKMNC